MPQRRVFGDASEFPFYDLRDGLLDLRIIAADDLLHTIHAVGIAERGYFRDRNVRRRLSGELLPCLLYTSVSNAGSIVRSVQRLPAGTMNDSSS